MKTERRSVAVTAGRQGGRNAGKHAVGEDERAERIRKDEPTYSDERLDTHGLQHRCMQHTLAVAFES